MWYVFQLGIPSLFVTSEVNQNSNKKYNYKNRSFIPTVQTEKTLHKYANTCRDLYDPIEYNESLR